MKINKDIVIGSLLFILGGFVFAFGNEKIKNKKKDRENNDLKNENERLKNGYLTLLEKYLLTQNSIEPSVITELQDLKMNIDQLETKVHIELDSVIKQVNNGEGPKAIKDLAKIVENKLKEKVNNDDTFTGKPMLHNLLEHAKKRCWISSGQFENGMLLKNIRNKESHELAVNITTREIGMSIYIGVDIIYAIS